MGKRIGELLLDFQLISPQQLEEAVAEQQKSGGKLGDIIIRRGLVTAEDLEYLLSRQLSTPSLNLRQYTPAPEVLSLIPEWYMRKNLVVPVEAKGRIVTVAMADPKDYRILDELRFITGKQVTPLVSSAYSIKETIQRLFGGKKKAAAPSPVSAGGAPPPAPADVSMPSSAETPEDALSRMANAPLNEAAQLLLGAAVGAGASHIHILRRTGKAEVRLRAGGKLRPPQSVPLHVADAVLNKLRSRANVSAPVKRYPMDGVFRVRVGERRFRFRLSSLGGAEGDHIVISVESAGHEEPLALDRIGMRPETLDAYRKAVGRESGLLLYVAPPLMGKTTTIYATLNALKGPDRLAMTYETPVKSRIEGVEQVDPSLIPGLDPLDGLRALLDQDADILMIGDVSSTEAMRTAVHAALDGALVLGRAHGRSALEFLPNMTSRGISAVHLATSLAGVLGQRLADRLCPHCAKPQVPAPPLREEMEHALGRKVSLIHRASGCPQCGGTGKAGRVGIFEFFPGGKALQRLLLHNVPPERIEMEARESGLDLLVKDGMEKVLEGVTSYESLHAVL